MKLNAQITFFSRVSFVEKLLFTKHLGMMIKSGIPIGEAIDVIRQQAKNPALKELLESVLLDVSNGKSLEKALSRHPKTFDPFYINLIRIGEESGNLETNLGYLAEQLKKEYEFKKKVQGALLYPIIILLVTSIAGGGISFFVLPKLVDLFSSLDVKLPLSTKILLFIANSMRDYGYLIFAGIIVFFILFRVALTRPKILIVWQKLLFSLPAIGGFLQDVELASLCRNMGMMLKSGLPITTALAAQYNATNNLVFKQYLKVIVEEVDKGKPIAARLEAKPLRYIPSLFAKMLGVGEKTGKLDESFTYLADFFSDEVDEYSKNLSTILEPVILIIIGLVVAFVAMAVISPIYQLTSGIHR